MIYRNGRWVKETSDKILPKIPSPVRYFLQLCPTSYCFQNLPEQCYRSLFREGTSYPNCKTFSEVSSEPKCWKERTDSHAYRILDKEFYMLAALSLEFPQEKPVRK